MFLSENLKTIIKKESKECKQGYSYEDYCIVTELILTYLHEFKCITSHEDFNKELFPLWHTYKAIPHAHPICVAMRSLKGMAISETEKIFYSSPKNIDENLIACAASFLSYNPDVWEAVRSMFEVTRS